MKIISLDKVISSSHASGYVKSEKIAIQNMVQYVALYDKKPFSLGNKSLIFVKYKGKFYSLDDSGAMLKQPDEDDAYNPMHKITDPKDFFFKEHLYKLHLQDS